VLFGYGCPAVRFTSPMKNWLRVHFHQVYFAFASGSCEDQKYWKLIFL
jgi:hypothetical protein